MKVNKISLIASSAILGSALFVGCGSSDNPPATTSVAPVNKYVLLESNETSGFVGSLAVATLEDNTTVNPTGQNADYTLVFPGTLGAKDTVSINGGWIDIDLDRDVNATIDKLLKQQLKAPGNAKYATPLSTLAVNLKKSGAPGADELLEASLNFDPVKAYKATDSKTRALLMLDAALTAIGDKNQGELAKITDVNLTKLTETAESNSTNIISAISSDASLDAAINTAAAKTDSAIKVVQAIIASGASEDDAFKFAIKFEETNNSATAVLADLNISNLDTTTIQDEINAADAADANVSEIPQAIKFLGNKLTVGGVEVVTDVTTGEFGNISLSVDKETSLVDYYSISASVDKDTIESSVTESANLSVTIKDNSADNNLTFTITGAEITTDAGNSLTVKLPAAASLTVTNNGLEALTEITPNMSVVASLDSELELNDLSFSVKTLLDNLSSNSEKITTTLAELDAYLVQNRSYTVTLEVETDIPFEVKKVSGLVTITNSEDATTPEAPAANFELQASYFEGKVIVFEDSGEETTLSFIDGTHYTDVSSDENSSGTWSVSGNKLTLNDVNDGAITVATFTAAPAKDLVVSVTAGNKQFSSTIKSIDNYVDDATGSGDEGTSGDDLGDSTTGSGDEGTSGDDLGDSTTGSGDEGTSGDDV